MKLAFDLFSSFDIDIPGLFNLLFQTNCSEQEHFLNDEKKLLFITFTIALYLPFKSPPCVCFFMKMKVRLLCIYSVQECYKKPLADFVQIVSSCAIYIAEEDLSPYTSSSCYHPPKYMRARVVRYQIFQNFRTNLFSSIFDRKYLAPEIRNY